MTRDIDIQIRDGNIVDAEADVIVSSIIPSRDLKKGALSSWVHGRAGDSVQDELYKNTQKDLNNGEVVKTGPGNLHHPKVLLFCCLYSWRESNGNATILRNAIKECCDKADAEGATSIAFPCLGTGYLRFPLEEAANAMMDAFSDFMKESGTTSVKRITIVLPLKDPAWLQRFVFIFAKRMSGGIDKTEIYIPDEKCDEVRKLRQEIRELRQGNDKLRKEQTQTANRKAGSSSTTLLNDSITIGPLTVHVGVSVNMLGVSSAIVDTISPYIKGLLKSNSTSATA